MTTRRNLLISCLLLATSGCTQSVNKSDSINYDCEKSSRPPEDTEYHEMEPKTYPAPPEEFTEESIIDFTTTYEVAYATNHDLDNKNEVITDINIHIWEKDIIEKTENGFWTAISYEITEETEDAIGRGSYITHYYFDGDVLLRERSSDFRAGDDLSPLIDPREKPNANLVECYPE